MSAITAATVDRDVVPGVNNARILGRSRNGDFLVRYGNDELNETQIRNMVNDLFTTCGLGGVETDPARRIRFQEFTLILTEIEARLSDPFRYLRQ